MTQLKCRFSISNHNSLERFSFSDLVISWLDHSNQSCNTCNGKYSCHLEVDIYIAPPPTMKSPTLRVYTECELFFFSPLPLFECFHYSYTLVGRQDKEWERNQNIHTHIILPFQFINFKSTNILDLLL